MTTETIRIVAAVVDTENLTMYRQDGKTIVIPQGDPRVRAILDQAIPQIQRQNYADIVITAVQQENHFQRFEEKSNGVVRLFKVARSKIVSFFKGKEAVLPQNHGSIPVPQEAPQKASSASEKVEACNAPTHKEKTLSEAVNEILDQAVPVGSADFNTNGLTTQGHIADEEGDTPNRPTALESQDTVVALVDGKLIPNMELIETQFARAAKLGSTVGVEKFLQRIAAVIDRRNHSIEDLLRFLERGDLPIADDGSILIYKVLNLTNGDSRGTFKDCHSGNVYQSVGDYVCMDESMVDHDRRNECSNGLHVARRGYVGNFGGSTCVLAKLAPEDVIAVPQYDANKMRVCGYHIIAELTAEQYNLLNRNKPITELEDGKVLLAKALRGKHVGRLREVRITKQKGGGLQFRPLVDTEEIPEILPEAKVGEGAKQAPAVAEALTNREEEAKAPVVDPKALTAEVHKTRKEIAKEKFLHWLDLATDTSVSAELVEVARQDVLKFKREAKASWDTLGIDPHQAAGIMDEPTEAVEYLPKEEKPAPYVHPTELIEGSNKERIAKLFALGNMDSVIAHKILEIKKASKKGWSALGVSDEQRDEVLKFDFL